MPDHEVHEIQLNGKQLVFMFMAATVVSVVIFLSGVMVGRGVRLPEAGVLAASADPGVDPTAPIEASSGTALTDSAPAPTPDNLTYAEHLEAPVAPDEPLKPPQPRPGAAQAVAEKASASKVVAPRETAPRETREPSRPAPAAEKPAVKPEAAAASKGFAEPGGDGFAVQVQAFPAKADADTLASRLKAKGYPAFVTLNNGGPSSGRYRVRVGKYPSKREADVVAARLQQEERFKPWVTR